MKNVAQYDDPREMEYNTIALKPLVCVKCHGEIQRRYSRRKIGNIRQTMVMPCSTCGYKPILRWLERIRQRELDKMRVSHGTFLHL